jgi:hypothetical protein
MQGQTPILPGAFGNRAIEGVPYVEKMSTTGFGVEPPTPLEEVWLHRQQVATAQQELEQALQRAQRAGATPIQLTQNQPYFARMSATTFGVEPPTALEALQIKRDRLARVQQYLVQAQQRAAQYLATQPQPFQPQRAVQPFQPTQQVTRPFRPAQIAPPQPFQPTQQPFALTQKQIFRAPRSPRQPTQGPFKPIPLPTQPFQPIPLPTQPFQPIPLPTQPFQPIPLPTQPIRPLSPRAVLTGSPPRSPPRSPIFQLQLQQPTQQIQRFTQQPRALQPVVQAQQFTQAQQLPPRRVILEEISWTVGDRPEQARLAVGAPTIILTLSRDVFGVADYSVRIDEPVPGNGIPVSAIFEGINRIPALQNPVDRGDRVFFEGIEQFFPQGPQVIPGVEYYEVQLGN